MKKRAATTSVHVRIARVTLHGYGPRDRVRFASALRSGLQRLVPATARLDMQISAGRNIARIDAGTLRDRATIEEAANRVVASIAAALAPSKGPLDA